MTSSHRSKATPTLILVLFLLTLTACGGGAGHSVSTDVPLIDVSVRATTLPAIALSGTVQFEADGTYRVSSTQLTSKDLTQSATWTTSDASVATVNGGIATGTGVGSATITATFGGKAGSATIVVGLTPTITISPAGPFSRATTPNVQFQAKATYTDGSVLDLTGFATWDSNPAGILRFQDPVELPGTATFIADGTTSVTATQGTDVGTLSVTVNP